MELNKIMKSRATAMKKGLILFNHPVFINAIKIEKLLFALKFYKSTQINNASKKVILEDV